MTSFFNPASEANEIINRLFWHYSIAATIILFLVIGFTVYARIRFRATKSRRPAQFTRSRKVELSVLTISMLLVTYFGYRTVSLMSELEPRAEGQEPDIVVTGHQWWWEVEYPGEGVVTANEFHIPTGKRLLVQLNSTDVIHSFWVPKLGGKKDMIPGYTNFLWIDAKEAGEYMGVCSEFCGEQHAWMRFRVVAHEPESFEGWLSEHRQQAKIPKEGMAAEGARFFQEMTCSKCHTIRGFNESNNIGPDLTHLASREEILAGMLDNNPENLKDWLQDPYEVKPLSHMQDMILTNKELESLVAFLNELQ